MANVTTPQGNTYRTETIQLVEHVFPRGDTDKDALFQNCIIDMVRDRMIQQFDHAILKRPGTTEVVSSSAITSTYRGQYYWQSQNIFVYVLGNTFYFLNLSTNTTTSTSALTTSTGTVGFEEYLYDDGHVTLVWADGTNMGEISTSLVSTTSTSPNVPSPHVPSPVFLNGYIFLVKANTQDTYNSDLNSPLSWTSGNFISAEMSPDVAVNIIKMSNYLIVFGQNSIEFFYDAGNASGSPLNRNDIFYKQIKLLGGIAKLGNKVIFVGEQANGGPNMFSIEDAKVTPMDNLAVRKHLARVTDFTNCTGVVACIDSYDLYIFTSGSATFVVNLGNDFTSTWAYQSDTKFNAQYSSNVSNSNGITTYMYMPFSNSVVKFSLSTWQDSGVNYQMLVRSKPLDFETIQMKFMGRLSINGDNNTGATIMIYWTDDDYQTYSNQYPIVMNQELPSIRRLGGFRKRTIFLTNSENYPVRIKELEVDLNMGTS